MDLDAARKRQFASADSVVRGEFREQVASGRVALDASAANTKRSDQKQDSRRAACEGRD